MRTNKDIKNSILIVIFVCLLTFSNLCYSYTTWNEYYSLTYMRKPSNLLIEALKRYDHKGIAIDLGCGAGNETVYLLQNGWNVTSIDADPLAFNWLKQKIHSSYTNNINVLISPFELLAWEDIVPSDFILAINTLPFINQENFLLVWQKIVANIKQGGRFCGTFFGPRYKAAFKEEILNMTFLSKSQVLNLFDDFDIEYFEVIDKNSISADGAKTYKHQFQVIAKKRVDK